MRCWVSMGESICGGSNIAASMSRVKGYSSAVGLSAPLANEVRGRVSMGESICGGSNIAASMSRVDGYSSAVGLSAPLANEMRCWVSMGESICGGANIAGGESKAVRLCQGSGKEGGGENEELHLASAFLPTAG